MASSCITSLLAPSAPIKIIPYVPRATRPRPVSKAKSVSTTKTAEHSRSGVSSSEDDGRDWFDIDDFPILDSNASCSLNLGVPAPLGAADASDSIDYDVVSSLGAASGSEKLEHDQYSQELLDRVTDHATSVANASWALNSLLDGSSPEFPLLLESDTAEEHHRTIQVRSSSRTLDYQRSSYHAAAGLYDNLNAASMCVLPEKGIEDIHHEAPSLAADESLFDVDVISRSPLTRKPIRRLSVSTIIYSAEVPSITSGLELGDTHLAKRQRLSERQAESLIVGHVSTPVPTPLPTPSDPDFQSRTNNESSPDPLDDDSQDGGAANPGPSSNNLDEDGAGASHEDKLDQVDKGSGRPVMNTSRRSKRSDYSVQKKRRDLSQATFKQRGRSTMPTRALRNASSSQPSQLPKSRMDSVTQSRSPRLVSPGTKAGDGTNKFHGSSASIAYQITDLTHYHVPEGSSIVAATVHCSESNLPPNLIALDYKLLGSEGKVIRTTQLSPNLWMLLGYRYDGGASGVHSREDPMLLNADRASSPFSDAASAVTDYIDDEKDEEYGNREESDVYFRRRTRIPWLESDEQRLLSYKDKMRMKWKDVFPQFKGRSEGAVRTRYHMLKGKEEDEEGTEGDQ